MTPLRQLPLLLVLLACDDGADDPAPVTDAAAAPLVDVFVPPRDAYIPREMYTPPPEPLDIGECVGRLATVLGDTFGAEGCADYNEAELTDIDSPYYREPIVAACLELKCANVVVMGHNGIPAVRSCSDIADLQLVLNHAAEEATAGETCEDPVFRVRVIPLEAFVGGEPCDQYACEDTPDGMITDVIP